MSERDRETERQRDRERQRQRQTERERETDRQTETGSERQTDKQTDRLVSEGLGLLLEQEALNSLEAYPVVLFHPFCGTSLVALLLARVRVRLCSGGVTNACVCMDSHRRLLNINILAGTMDYTLTLMLTFSFCTLAPKFIRNSS